MSQRDDAVPMRHMLDHAREACALVAGRNRTHIHEDRLLQLGLTRLVEIVGRLPVGCHASHRRDSRRFRGEKQ